MTTSPRLYEPTESVYLGAISGSAVLNDFVDYSYFSTNLGLNLLFFDSASVQATSLLSNTEFFELYRREKDAIKQIFETGLLRPTLLHTLDYADAKNFDDVAELMIENRTYWGSFSRDVLRKHATEFANCNPAYLSTPRNDYYELGITVALHIIKTKMEDEQKQTSYPALKSIYDCIMSDKKNGILSQSKIWRALDADSLYNPISNEVKSITDFSVAYAEAFLLGSRLSIDDETSNYKRFFKRNQLIEASADPLGFVDRQDYEIGLPFKNIALLSLEDILSIRDLQPFKEVRSALNSARAGVQIEAQKLADRLSDCGSFLSQYSGGSVSQREKIILKAHNLQRNEKSTLRTYFNSYGLVAVSIAEAYASKSITPFAVMCWVGAGHLNEQAKKSIPIGKTWFDTNITPDSKYNTLQSELKLLEKGL